MKEKDRLTFFLLGFFFGGFGIHNFYAGYIGRGIAQLLITILSFGTVSFGTLSFEIPSFVSCVWALVEICLVRCDGSGRTFSK